MENLQFCATSYMPIKVTSSTLACAVSTISWAKSSFQRLKMRLCTLNIVEAIFALKQCDDCINLGMSAKPESMENVERIVKGVENAPELVVLDASCRHTRLTPKYKFIILLKNRCSYDAIQNIIK